MSEKVTVNVDTSVIGRHLYATILPDKAQTGFQFENDGQCREYFESPDVFVIAGGKAVSEFENLCSRRHELYQDMVNYLRTNGDSIFSYSKYGEGVDLNENDATHVRKGVQMNMHHIDSPREQATILRRCFQQIGICRNHILNNELDDTEKRYYDTDLRSDFANLDIGHDVDILVDAAYLSHEKSIIILAAVDSDITTKTETIVEIAQEHLDPNLTLTIIDADRTGPNELTKAPADD
ncbi:hypothetical protein [Methanonatronarchaeum sp. AMET6-2]|uniref:hypothetical protein n=1 Tax=Methanonatronarchaeum sp. AMET6-2 TaxID=2933293 RepID=UPI001FF670B2|nr:hypothetical protein [Methanonatronarchaeum sp. AMET6-2]UOY10611.1 hypothetical protein MU439_02945 [Methanonatronarchaeum sp. AMET6-2]